MQQAVTRHMLAVSRITVIIDIYHNAVGEYTNIMLSQWYVMCSKVLYQLDTHHEWIDTQTTREKARS